MKKSLFSLVCCFLLVVVGSLLSCKSSSGPSQTTTQTDTDEVTTIVEHDTIFVTQPDHTYLQMYLECINGQVVAKDQSVTPAKKNTALQTPKAKVKDNVLFVDCELKEAELRAKWQSENKTKTINTTKTVTVPVERELTFWQNLQIWAGRILLVLIAAYFIGRYLKTLNPLS